MTSVLFQSVVGRLILILHLSHQLLKIFWFDKVRLLSQLISGILKYYQPYPIGSLTKDMQGKSKALWMRLKNVCPATVLLPNCFLSMLKILFSCPGIALQQFQPISGKQKTHDFSPEHLKSCSITPSSYPRIVSSFKVH